MQCVQLVLVLRVCVCVCTCVCMLGQGQVQGAVSRILCLRVCRGNVCREEPRNTQLLP